MAPFIVAREDMVGGTPGQDSRPAPNTTSVLIIVAAVSGATILAMGIFLIVDKKRRRQYQEACKRDPYLSRKEFARRRKMSSLQRMEEEELQRSIMIRKSLATRSSRTNSQTSEIFEIPSIPNTWHSRNLSQDSVVSLNRDRSKTVPNISFTISTNDGWEDRELPPPPRSRTASPSRSPLLKPRATSSLPSLPVMDQKQEDLSEVLLANPMDSHPAHSPRGDITQ